MADEGIHNHIEQLVAEEHELWQREQAGQASDEDRERLAKVKVSLDQSWDMLRQRRGRFWRGRPRIPMQRASGTARSSRATSTVAGCRATPRNSRPRARRRARSLPRPRWERCI